ncbi:NAD-dependent epimerase/dehydratase family protein [Paenibacillus sp. LMG 31456]|uniref:NAD-dependent epimerase/dehydratase family protein n=1 Tax=Paenibacillus foliorum TaxID=2654974 RepID=A0A972GM77_9BACL|nr:NAD-dependent epimerase/dehydratase family protein [Paenibacillus foliorum]NOU93282.1 NAD-dependent epimerase/dehydratase family protein [Paenibacillus foliorum]
MGKIALIIGGSGFLGSAITAQLIGEGWDTHVLSRGNKPVTQGSTIIQVDRSIQEELQEALEGRHYDLVVDCAGYKELDVANALHSLNGRCGHYVFISTDYVYASTTRAVLPIAESAETQRDTAYAAGKLDCERLLLDAWDREGFPVTVLRPPHILGAGKELGSDQVLGRDTRLLNKIRTGEGLQLLVEGQMLIQPVWTREIACCIAHIAGMEQSFGHIFNCAGLEAVTAKRYYEIVAGMLGVELKFSSVPLHSFLQNKPNDVHHARHRIYDTSRLTQVTGYKPQLKLEDALKETLDWMLSKEGTGR